MVFVMKVNSIVTARVPHGSHLVTRSNTLPHADSNTRHMRVAGFNTAMVHMHTVTIATNKAGKANSSCLRCCNGGAPYIRGYNI